MSDQKPTGLDLDQLRPIMCTIAPGELDSFVNWGKLVKTWVTGKSQFADHKDRSIPASKDSLPLVGAMTKEQFKQMLDGLEIKMTIPDKVKKFVFVRDDDSTVVVRLPSKEVVQNIEKQFEGVGDAAPYPLPAFYPPNWGTAVQRSLNKDQLTTMHCQRIGEYTINTCA